MRDFADELDRRLQVIAAPPLLTLVSESTPEPPIGAAPASESRPHPRRRRPAFSVGAAAALAAGACGVMLSGTSPTGLPILATESTEARALAAVPELSRANVDFGKAHAFGTRGGPGFVLTDEPGRRVCVTIPDPSSPGQYAGTCGKRADTEGRGLLIEIAGDRARDPLARNDAAFILPLGATQVRVRHQGGPWRLAHPQSGVVVASIDTAATVSFMTDAGRRTIELQGPFDGGAAFCNGPVDTDAASPAPGAASGRTPPGASPPLPEAAICP